MFWRSLGPNSEAPVYGADTLGTLFAEDDSDAWNVGRLVRSKPGSASAPYNPSFFLSASSTNHARMLAIDAVNGPAWWLRLVQIRCKLGAGASGHM